MPDELELLRDLGREHADGAEASAARARVLLEQRIAGQGRQPRRPRGARKSLLVATAALAVGGVIGLGAAGSFAPSGSARTLGFGFVPVQGWNVVQPGVPDGDGVAYAIAANLAIDSRDTVQPRATPRRLPARGVVMAATFSPRGDAQVDAGFPARQLPLLVADAQRMDERRWEQHAAIRGYNVSLEIHLGTAEPSARQWAAVQRQLDRLLVAAERVTIFAQPSVVGNQPLDRSVRLFGSVDSRNEGESVAIQVKDCGTNFFRLVDGATTESGGTYSTRYWPDANTAVRAVWNDIASSQIEIRVRVFVGLYKRRDGKSLRVVASGVNNFWRKRVEIQRFERRLGIWRRLRTVVLTDSGGNRGSGPNVGRSGSMADFLPRVPRGTLLRAVMPLSQAKPCYLAGTSASLRW